MYHPDVRPPLWNVPYQRNPFFTGREDVLNQLHHDLYADSVVALSHPQGISGLGGIGKTQTALEYAYRYQNDYHAIFWVRAASITALTTSMTELAHILKLPERHEQNQEIVVEAVLRWLRLHPDWLLIYDNADDLAALDAFLPKTGTGHVLITTRAYALGGLAQRLDIQKMQPEVGALLLLRRANLLTMEATLYMTNTDDRGLACAISQEVDGLPLALDQAGTYIKETSCSLPEYLTRYQTRRNDLLRARGSFDQDYLASVATTWSLSFEKVRQANPVAAELLNFCAFLAPDAIPEKLLTIEVPTMGNVLSPIATDPLQVNLACKEALRFSLIQRNADERVITMHRLVQSVLQESLPKEMQTLWQQKAVSAVSTTFPSIEYENWPDCQQLLPHAQICAEWMRQSSLPSPQGAPLLLRAGYYSHERAQEQVAASLLEQSLAAFTNLYGDNHPLVADALNNLALVYKTQGKQQEAETLFLQALSIDAKAQETQNRSARSLNNLANLYQEQSRYQEAETLFLQALELDKQTYGAEHREVATDLNNLALLYRIQGRYDEAEPLARQALALKEKEHGNEHPATAKNINNLAALYYEQERYDEAQTLYERALAIRMRIYESDHPEIASSLNNLALLYEKQGKISQAEAYLQKALTMKVAVYGEKHSTVANTQNNLARLFQQQQKYAEAEKLFCQALEAEEYFWGADHVSIARSYNNIAVLYYEQERYSEAEPLLKKALTIFEKVHGSDHITIANTHNSFALIYVAQERYAEAAASYVRAHPIYERVYGTEDIVVANNFSSLGLVYMEQENYQRAEICLARAFALYEQKYGQEHPAVTQSLNHLAVVYYLQRDLVKAEPLYLRVLDNFERILGSDHVGVAQCLENLAALYVEQTRYTEALSLYQRALQIYQQHLEPSHPQIKATHEAYQWCQRQINTSS